MRCPLRILCISPAFVPMMDAEAFAGTKMVMALRDLGVEFVVLCDDAILLKDEERRDTSRVWDDVRSVSIALTAPAGPKGVASIIAGLRYRIHGAQWVQMAVRRARQLHREDPFDVVYSRSPPALAHVAGYHCARSLGLPWVANINDPWDWHLVPWMGRKVSRLRAMLSMYWLRKTLRTADLLAYPCRRLKAFTESMSGVPHDAEVFPHVGWSVPQEVDKATFHLVHAGNLHSPNRSAEGLLTGVQEFLRDRPEAQPITRITFIGRGDAKVKPLIAEHGLASVVSCTGKVPYEESLKWIGRATVCVLIEASVPEGIYLPSKFADYVTARKPVLALSPAVGTIADMLPEPGLIRVDADNPSAIARAINDFYEDFQKDALDAREPSEGLIQKFDPPSVAASLLAALRDKGIGAVERAGPVG